MSAERKKLILALCLVFAVNIFLIALAQHASADLYKRGSSGSVVREIQTRKTGGLIRAACGLGVLCGGGTAEQFSAALRYADGVGLAFQIRDDMLDVIGDAKTLGKAVGVDAGKNTFVRLYGLEACARRVEAETEAACKALSVFSEPELLTELARYLADRSY